MVYSKNCNIGVGFQNWVYHITPNEPSLIIIIHYLPEWLEINGHHPRNVANGLTF
jgi:hypothetical protein